jgi:uncharacterized protein
MRLDATPAKREPGAPRDNRFEPARGGPRAGGQGGGSRQPEPAGAMASAFAKLQGVGKR